MLHQALLLDPGTTEKKAIFLPITELSLFQATKVVQTHCMVLYAGLDGVTMLRRTEASLGEVIIGLGLEKCLGQPGKRGRVRVRGWEEGPEPGQKYRCGAIRKFGTFWHRKQDGTNGA